MEELLYEKEFALCDAFYRVCKETCPSSISVIVYLKKGDLFIEKCRAIYKNVGEEYSNPFLSWYNLVFCSNQWGCAPDYEYMNYAVQDNKKTAATLYLDSEQIRQVRQHMPPHCNMRQMDCGHMFIYHKGRLADFFDYDSIKRIYELHEVYGIDWEAVKRYFDMPLSFFASKDKCGFSVQTGGNNTEQAIVNGLILGYPIESTIGFIGKGI